MNEIQCATIVMCVLIISMSAIGVAKEFSKRYQSEVKCTVEYSNVANPTVDIDGSYYIVQPEREEIY